MKRDTLVQLVAGVVGAAALSASGLFATALTSSAGRHKLTYEVQAEKSDPPQVALGIAMGAFRGLFVNALWIRAQQLKEEGRYYESVDLASTITKLQPRFPMVWSFHAWNLAYNISVATNTLRERWSWVNQGINLLRKEGVVWNPNDLVVHKELGWIFLHKISGVMDDANPYYKRQLAIEWTEVLGPPPLPAAMESRDEAIARYVDWLTPIAEAPDSLADLTAARPDVAQLVNDLETRAGRTVGRDLAVLVVQAEAMRRSPRWSQFAPRGEQSAALVELLADESRADAWSALLAHLRRRILIDEYNMEPSRMVRYTEKFGPLDWRLAPAHAAYWTQRGIEGALSRVTEANRKDYDFLNTDRIVIQSVQELYRNGDLYFDYLATIVDPANPSPVYLTAPSPYYIETYRALLEELVARGGIFENRGERIFTVFAAGYENFMKDAIRFLYRRGQVDLAVRYKDDLGAWEGQNLNDPKRAEYFAMPIDEFVKVELYDRLLTGYVATSEFIGALQAAFVGGLLQGQNEIYVSNLKYARLVHGFFTDNQLRSTAVNPAEARLAYFTTDFTTASGLIFLQMLTSLGRDDAETVYQNAPVELRRFMYDMLAESLRAVVDEEAKNGGRPFDVVFPEPDGMDLHRAAMARVAEEMKNRQLDLQQR